MVFPIAHERYGTGILFLDLLGGPKTSAWGLPLFPFGARPVFSVYRHLCDAGPPHKVSSKCNLRSFPSICPFLLFFTVMAADFP